MRSLAGKYGGRVNTVIVNGGSCSTANCGSGVTVVDYPTGNLWMEQAGEYHQTAIYDARGQFAGAYRESPYSKYGYTSNLASVQQTWIESKISALLAGTDSPTAATYSPTQSPTNENETYSPTLSPSPTIKPSASPTAAPSIVASGAARLSCLHLACAVWIVATLRS